jgi:hypothetical protein
MRILYLFLSFLLLSHFTYAQLTVKIKGGNQRICDGMSLTLTDSIVSGTPTSYTWNSTVATFANSTSNTTSATFSTSGNVVLKTEAGTNTFFDTIYVVVDTLPTVEVRGDLDVCCDYGIISLDSFILTKSIASTGNWSCSSKPTWISSNHFFVDSACGLTSSSTYAKYTIQDTNTGCFNSDSIRITVRPLPQIIVKEGDFCQDVNEINLKKQFVISPATFIGTPSWKCLDCNGNDFSKMLIDKGSGGIMDYWLDVSKVTYTFKNAQKDTIKLEFNYTDAYGCKNRDTVSFRLWRVPEITFSSYRDLCWEEGKISLNTLYGVNITGGRWEVYDTLGFRLPNQLAGINGDTINTLNSTPLSNENAIPNKWILRYTHTSSGCPTLKDTTLRIFPSPKITLTDFDKNPPNYCETNSNITLAGNPSGGSWSASDPSALTGGNAFNPSFARVQSKPIWFYYNYTSTTTGCKNIDSIYAIVDPAPRLNIPADTSFCKPLGSAQTNLSFAISAENNSTLDWFAVNFYNNANRVSLATAPVFNATLLHQNQEADTFRIIVYAGGKGSCNDIDDFFEIIVNPIPEARIIASNPSGCNPVTSDFEVSISNNINTNTTQYNWDLGNGTASSSDVPNATYTANGTTNLSVLLTTDNGCDTTLVSSIYVYPTPVASFNPNPNNNAPLDTPRFQFINTSHVNHAYGSSIVGYRWNFGTGSSDDTSSFENPSFFYPSVKASYQVFLEITTNQGCSDIASRAVHIGKPGSVGISSVDDVNFTVFPNPNTGQFKLANINATLYDVYLIDNLGDNLGTLQCNSEGIYMLSKSGIYSLIIENKQSLEQYNAHLIVIKER